MILVNASQVVTGRVLGTGELGIVYFGIYKSEPVAIKKMKRSVDIDDFKAVVLAEAKIMAYLGDLESIVKFVGADISEIARSNPCYGYKAVNTNSLSMNL